MKLKLFLSMALTTALVAALAAPALAYQSQTEAPSKYIPSGAKVAVLWSGFYGTSNLDKILVHVNVSDFFTVSGASEATLTTKCEFTKLNGSKGVRAYTNKVKPDDKVRTITWGPNRACDKIVSVFLRAFPGDLDGDGSENDSWATRDEDDVALAVDRLTNTPWWPDNRPLRITIGSFN